MDPSCSGSGLPEHHLGVDTASDAADVAAPRLKRLAAFQRRILSLRPPLGGDAMGIRGSIFWRVFSEFSGAFFGGTSGKIMKNEWVLARVGRKSR